MDPALVTAGDDVAGVARFLPAEGLRSTVADVVRGLTETVVQNNAGVVT